MEVLYYFLFYYWNKFVSFVEIDFYFIGVVDVFFIYINQEYGDEYEEVEVMFGRGYVNVWYIEKFFRLNDIIISDDK